MATKSILKNINIKTKPQAEKLIWALENAEKYAVDLPPLSKPCKDVKGNDIKKLFAAIRGEEE